MKKIIVLLSISLIAIVLLEIYYYLHIEYNLTIPCLFYKISGFYCPGCGVTRMLFSIINLDLYQAFRYNPLIFTMLPFVIIYIIDTCIKWLNNKNNYMYLKINNKTWIIVLIITISFGVLRNISIFKFLTPTTIG